MRTHAIGYAFLALLSGATNSLADGCKEEQHFERGIEAILKGQGGSQARPISTAEANDMVQRHRRTMTKFAKAYAEEIYLDEEFAAYCVSLLDAAYDEQPCPGTGSSPFNMDWENRSEAASVSQFEARMKLRAEFDQTYLKLCIKGAKNTMSQ